MRRIIQVLDTLSYGDAIGNHTLAIHKNLLAIGRKSNIYASQIDDRLKGYAAPFSSYQVEPDDILIYHLSTWSPLNEQIQKLSCKIVIDYHNITPPGFFKEYSRRFYDGNVKAYQEAAMLAERADYAFADSPYNAVDLRQLGYTCQIDVVPIIINFSDYTKKPDDGILRRYGKAPDEDYKNIIFVGRIAPNKKQEDIIADFSIYQKYYNEKSRLILVGNSTNMEEYYLRLKKYTKKLGVKNVVFTGHIPFSQILAYYRTADLFLCESEHEGFCVPLVEAMYFHVPIIAYASSAIPDTLGSGGLLTTKKAPGYTAALMETLFQHTEIVHTIQEKQKDELKRFDEASTFQKLLHIIDSIS